jgi:hypothetical protein
MATYEKYGQSATGVDLYWYKYPPVGVAQGQKVPAIIGLHPGGYHAGSSLLSPQGKSLSRAGFLFFGTEYRLAPPSKEMNTPLASGGGFQPGNHPNPGQDTVADHGYFPEHGLDVRMAIIAAKLDPQCDGRVYGIGGSAGASHVIYNLLTATEGVDKFDLGVACSIGVFDLYRSEIWAIMCDAGGETCPHSAIANYLNIADTFPAAPTGADLLTAKSASPSFIFDANKIGGKLWVLLSNRDSPGIPTSTGYACASYTKAGVVWLNETAVTTGFLPAAIAAGLTASTADFPEAGKYKFTFVDVASQGINHAHAFNYWGADIGDGRDVGQAIAEWLAAGAVQTAGDPAITSFAPITGYAGETPVVIVGENFDGTIGVRFNHIDALSFVVDSPTQITAIPAPETPLGDGPISVRTAVNTVNSDDPFTIAEIPTPNTDPVYSTKTPILNYPTGGVIPAPPTRPDPPDALDAHAIGTGHNGVATWIPPTNTSGATLLNYIGWLTSDTGEGGTVSDIPGTAVSADLSDLVADTNYTFHLKAVTAYGESDEVTAAFTSNSGGGGTPTVKDQPRGSLCLFQTPTNPTTGRKYVDWNPTNYWGNPDLRGGRYRTSWQNIAENPLDPNDTTYRDWSDVDAFLAKCTTFNQFAGISVAAGIYCPSWIVNNPRIRTIDEKGPDPGIMPIPWNELYLDSWISFLKEFAERYDTHDQLRYFVVGGLSQVVETYVAQDLTDLNTLLADAQDRGFTSINEAWYFAVNRVLFACEKAFKHTHFLLSMAKIVPDSWDNGAGTIACYDMAGIGKAISPTNFGVMNAGLNENSSYEPPNGFAPNIIIHDESPNMTVGFQFGASTGGDIAVFSAAMDAGVLDLDAKFIEIYKPDATSTDPLFIAQIQASNIAMDALP